MMRRGRYSRGRRRKFVCNRCGASPPWSAAEHHQQTCIPIPPIHRHRKDRS